MQPKHHHVAVALATQRHFIAGASGIFEWLNSTDPMWCQGFESEVVRLDAGIAVNITSISGHCVVLYHPLTHVQASRCGSLRTSRPTIRLVVIHLPCLLSGVQSTAACGQCDYYPHPSNMTVPWTCAYIAPVPRFNWFGNNYLISRRQTARATVPAARTTRARWTSGSSIHCHSTFH